MLARRRTILIVLVVLLPIFSCPRHLEARKKQKNGDFVGYVAKDVRITCDRWPDSSSLQSFFADACRLSNAITEQEKAIALLNLLYRTWVITDVKPHGPEPPMKIERASERSARESFVSGIPFSLNLLNTVRCGGTKMMGEVAADIWRVGMGKPAYLLYLPKYDYAAAHLWYRDDDGVERWHIFGYGKNSWYLFNRDASRIVCADDLVRDPSLAVVPSRRRPVSSISRQDTRGWIRMPGNTVDPLYEMKWPGITLTPGQQTSIYNNGRKWLQELVLDAKGGYQLLASTARPPMHFESSPPIPWIQALHVRDRETKGTLIWDFQACGAISTATVNVGLGGLGFHPGKATFFVSIDNGETWTNVYEFRRSKRGTEQISFGIGKKLGPMGPRGFHKFMLKCEIEVRNPADLGITRLYVQVPIIARTGLAAPLLQAGKNRIRVTGGQIPPGMALVIKYVWVDEDRESKEHTAVVKSLPFEYTIVTRASDVRNVSTKSITVTALPMKAVPAQTIEEATPKDLKIDWGPLIPVQPRFSSGKFSLGPEQAHINILAQSDSDSVGAYSISKRSRAARILASIATESSFDQLLPYLDDKLLRNWIIAAIGHTEHEKAVETLIPMLNEGTDWDQLATVVSLDRYCDEKVALALQKAYSFTFDKSTFVESKAKQWTALKVLARLQAESALGIMKGSIGKGKGLSRPDDKCSDGLHTVAGTGGIFFDPEDGVSIAAAQGLLAIPREKSLGPLFKAAAGKEGGILKIYAAKLAGVLKAKQYQRNLKKYLEFPHEEVRGWAAWALGEIGDYNGIFLIRSALKKEKSTWARRKMEDAIDTIKGANKNTVLIGL